MKLILYCIKRELHQFSGAENPVCDEVTLTSGLVGENEFRICDPFVAD